MEKIISFLRKFLKIFYYILMGNIIIYQKHMLPGLNSFEDYLTFNIDIYLFLFLIIYPFITYFGAIVVFSISIFISAEFLRFLLNKDDSYLEFIFKDDGGVFLSKFHLAITHLFIFIYFVFDIFLYCL